jgi:hypothetical protein
MRRFGHWIGPVPKPGKVRFELLAEKTDWSSTAAGGDIQGAARDMQLLRPEGRHAVTDEADPLISVALKTDRRRFGPRRNF